MNTQIIHKGRKDSWDDQLDANINEKKKKKRYMHKSLDNKAADAIFVSMKFYDDVA